MTRCSVMSPVSPNPTTTLYHNGIRNLKLALLWYNYPNASRKSFQLEERRERGLRKRHRNSIYMQRLCLTHTPFSQLLHTAFQLFPYSVSDCFILRFLHIQFLAYPAYPARSALFIESGYNYLHFICRLSFDRVPSAKYYYSYVVEILLVSNGNSCFGIAPSLQARIEACTADTFVDVLRWCRLTAQQRSWYSRAWILNTKLKKKTNRESSFVICWKDDLTLSNLHTL
jgi:hypothetical protein